MAAKKKTNEQKLRETLDAVKAADTPGAESAQGVKPEAHPETINGPGEPATSADMETPAAKGEGMEEEETKAEPYEEEPEGHVEEETERQDEMLVLLREIHAALIASKSAPSETDTPGEGRYTDEPHKDAYASKAEVLALGQKLDKIAKAMGSTSEIQAGAMDQLLRTVTRAGRGRVSEAATVAEQQENLAGMANKARELAGSGKLSWAEAQQVQNAELYNRPLDPKLRAKLG